jgi:hypothetical protein
MHNRRVWTLFSLLATLSIMVPAQTPVRMGVRAGYGLELPSKNIVNGQEYQLVEAGHRFNYGAFLDLGDPQRTTFSPYLGLEHGFWAKSFSYTQACEQDSFPTFWSVDDSLPGRDHRVVNVVLEPSIRIKLKWEGLYLRLVPAFSYVFQSKIENYTHTCNAPISRAWLDWEDSERRKQSKVNVGIGLGLAKEVRISERTGFSIETGARVTLSALWTVRAATAEEGAFTLQPFGFYVNLGFFR